MRQAGGQVGVKCLGADQHQRSSRNGPHDTVLRLQQGHALKLALIAIERRGASLEAKAAVRDAGARIAALITDQACHVSAWARKRAAELRALRRRVNEEAARLGLA